MPGQGCCKTVLARSPCAEVTRCSCGHIHLAVGPVTLRLDEGILRALGLTVSEALQRLGAPSAEPTEAALAAPTGGWKQ